jgi:hypothetical protein
VIKTERALGTKNSANPSLDAELSTCAPSSQLREGSNVIPVVDRRKPNFARAIKLRKASFQDYAAIVTLQSKYNLQIKSFEEWQRIWRNNPAYCENENTLPIGWVLEADEQNIVGYLGNIPLFYELAGERLLASVAHSWVAEPEYRSYSPLLLERYFSQKNIDLFLNATVGSQASQAFAAFHSLPIPVGTWDQSAFWVTNYRGFVANWLVMKKVPFAKSLSYVAGAGLFLRDSFARRHVGRDRTISLRQCTCIDSRFEHFWQALRKINSHLLIGVRSQQALQWHFGYALQQNNAWIVTAEKDSDLTAYAIFIRNDNPRLGLRRMRLVDFQTLDGNMEILESMLGWGLERCRIEGIHMLECIGLSAKKREVINRTAPQVRKLPCWLYYYKTYDQSLASRLSDPNVWDPSQFDGDASL